MKRILLYILFLLPLVASAQTLTPTWVNAIGGAGGADVVQATTVDASGNVYIAGSFSGTVNFNPSGTAANLTSAGSIDAFFAKYTSAGVLVWANRLGSTGVDETYGIAVDATGNVYVTGYFSGTVDFDPGTGTSNNISAGGTDIFYGKYSSSGAFSWAGVAGWTGSDNGLALDVDGSGSVYITGFFNGTVDFEPSSATSNKTSLGGNDIFLIKVSESGIPFLSWADTFGSTGSDIGIGIDVDATGVYLSGLYSGSMDLDPGTGALQLQQATNAGGTDGFFAKYSLSAGAWIMYGTVKSTGDDRISSIVASGTNFYVGGSFSTAAGFYSSTTPGAKTSNGGTDIFIAKYDASLAITWLNQIGGSGDDGINLLALDGSSNVYGTGFFNLTADFDPSSATSNLVSSALSDIYIAAYGSSSGSLIVAKKIGGTSDDEGASIAVDASNNVYVAGSFQNTASFDFSSSAFDKTSLGLDDGFISKYSQSGGGSAPTVSNFSPSSGLPGTPVTLTGTNFSTTPANNTVKFNGTTATITGTPTATSIVTAVPSGATSGPITVTVGSLTGTSSASFTVIATPTITSFTPASGAAGTSVTITGINFSATAANNIVFFGAMRASVTAATGTQLTVTVPAGATFQPISVTVGGLTGYSSKPFNVTFLSAGIDATSFAGKVDFAMSTTPLNLAVGDLDGDGKLDLIQPYNSGGSVVSVLRNTSTSGAISVSSFSPRIDLTTSSNPLNVAVGDLDGDGKLDLAVANWASSGVSVFRNVSTSGSLSAASFSAKVDFITPASPWSVAITDLDGDGKPDLAVSTGTTISIFRNTSSVGALTSSSFATKVDFTIPSAAWSVEAADIDVDGKQDLVVANGTVVSIFRNTSTMGAITSSSFAAKVDFTTGTSELFSLGDLDGDGKPELVALNTTGNAISVFRNTSSSGSITSASFAAKVDFATGSSPKYVSLGDLDGDGKIDLVSANNPSNTVSVLRNTSTSGSITAASFATKVDFATGTAPYGIAVGDIDGDGKSDLAVSNSTAATVSVLRNQIPTLLPPTITSFLPTSGNTGTPVTITGTNFSTTAANNIVQFNGITANITGTPTATAITAVVPAGATTGPIKVTVNGLVGTSATNFTVLSLQPTNFIFSSVTSTTLTASFTAPGTVPTGYIVFRKVGSASTTGVPTNGSSFVAGNQIGDGIVAYSGTGTTFNDTGLTAGAQYFYTAYSFNGTGSAITYITTGPLVGSQGLPTTGSLATEPSAQPTNLVFSAVTTTSYSAAFAAATGTPDGYIIITANNAAPTGLPVDGVTYAVGNSLAGGTGSVLSITNTNTFSASGLTAGTSVFAAVYAFKGTGAAINYYTIAPLVGNVTTFTGTLATAPSAQATALAFTSVTTSSFTVSFTAATGAPAGYIVLRKTGSAPSVGVPLSGTSYVAGALIGDGTVVYVGSATTFNESSLLSGTSYFYNVYAYNGSSTSISYLTATPLSGNQQTTSLNPTVASFLPTTGSVGTLVVITGTNFSTTPASNIVKFNGTTAAAPTLASATSLTVAVPTGAITGTVSVTVGTLTGTSTTTFTVIPPLTLTETFLTTYLKDGSSKVSVTVSDPSQVGSVKFWSKGITTKDPFASRAVTGSAGKFETAFTTAELADLIGLQYYFEVIDNTAKSIKSSTGAAYPTLASGSTEQLIPNLSFGSSLSNYQIIAVPSVLTNKSVSSALGALGAIDKKKWRLFGYSSGAYAEFPSSLDPGKGYFFIATTSVAINLGPGTPVQVTDTAPFTISLTAGWNLIGNPYNFRVSWQEVLDLNSNPTGLGQLKTFTGGSLNNATILEKFRGAFINSTTAMTLKIPVARNTTLGGRIADAPIVAPNLDNPQWNLNLVLTDGTLSNHLGGIGMHPQAKLAGIDPYDEVSFPLPEGFGMMAMVFRPAGAKEMLEKEIVPSADNHTWNFDIKHGSESPLLLQWNNDGMGSAGKKLVLFDPQTLQMVDMKRDNHYEFNEKTSKLRILYGTQDYINEALDKELPYLGTVYPNPVQDKLFVPFRVPLSMESADVNISVYDSQGKMTATLVNGEFKKGNYEGTWIPEVGSGLYFIQLRLGTNAPQSQKIIIK